MRKIENIILIAILLFLFSACSEEVVAPPKVVRPIKSQEVTYSSAYDSKRFPATAETDKVINLSFRSSGIISRFNVELGKKVRKGQLLAKLHNPQTQLAYEQAVAQNNSAISQLNTAKQSLDRARVLFEKGTVALSDYEAAKNAYRMAEQNVELTKRGVEIQKEQIGFNSLYAPKSGEIAAVDVEINENISPGQTVATLNVGQSMNVNIGIPESVINSVKLGDSVKVEFPSLAGQQFYAKVNEIAPSLSAGSGVYEVKAKLLGATTSIKTGMSANVEFNFGQNKMAAQMLLIPPQAVGEDKEGQFVYVVDNSQEITIVKKQIIQIGNLTTKGFEVRSGLSVGQRIAVAGLSSLWDGLEVKIKS